jgi:hypothetical protein
LRQRHAQRGLARFENRHDGCAIHHHIADDDARAVIGIIRKQAKINFAQRRALAIRVHDALIARERWRLGGVGERQVVARRAIHQREIVLTRGVQRATILAERVGGWRGRRRTSRDGRERTSGEKNQQESSQERHPHPQHSLYPHA